MVTTPSYDKIVVNYDFLVVNYDKIVVELRQNSCEKIPFYNYVSKE